MNIFEFDDYKEALKAFIRNKGPNQRGTYKNLALHLGVHATVVSQVLAGSKDFSEEQIFSVCEYLGIGKLESQYLWLLVQLERAGSVKLRQHYLEMKDQHRKQALTVANRVQKNRKLSDNERAIFYSSWIYSAIHMLASLDRKITFDEICARFRLQPGKAREILDFLIDIQMVEEKEGRFTTGPTYTHLEKKSPLILKHHTNWRLKAIQAAENLSDQELMYSANISVSKKDFARLREEMIQVIQRFIDVVKDSPAEDIAQFNLDLFWIS